MMIAPTANRTTATGTSTSTSTTQAITNSMGENSFLDLLITQMQNQDPTSPMDDTQFVSELAQFSSLEQMTQLNQQFGSLTQQNQNALAVNYLGKVVTYQDPSQSTPSTGTVTAIDYINGTPMLTIGTASIDPSWVTAVTTTQ